MGDDRPVKAKLWLEGLHAFRRHVREWLVGASSFFLILTVLCFVAFEQLYGPWQALPRPLPKDPNEVMKLLGPLIKPGLIWFAAIELVVLVQGYFFAVFFSRRELPAGKPVFGVARFLYSFAKTLQVTLIYVGVGVVSGIAVFAVKHAFAADEHSTKIALFIERLLTQGVICYVAIRYFFVYVLAVNKMRPVLKTSWKLTENNWWRLFWNLLVTNFLIVLFLCAVFLVSMVVAWLLRMGLHLPVVDPMGSLCIILMIVLAFTLLMGIAMAYCCAACRILIEEKRQSDPKFLLTTKA